MSNIIALKTKQPEPRVSGKKPLNGNQTAAIQPLNAEDTATKRQPDGSLTAAFYMCRDILNTQKSQQITTIHGKEAQAVLTGALCICKHIVPGQSAASAQLIKLANGDYSQFSIRMLTDKSKPVLVEVGILVKISVIKYRWASIEELQQALNPGAVATKKQQQTCTGTASASNSPAPAHSKRAPLRHTLSNALQQAIDNHQRRKAARDPWADILPDGSIKKHRKAFTGEYSPAEKKAIREAHERNSHARLLTKNPELTEEAKQLAEQKQLEMIERKASQAAQMDTLKMWAKVIGFLLAVYWVIGTLDNDPQPVAPPNADYLPSGIYGDSE